MNVACDGTQPNFFLIGAAKCGTTSVAKYLDQHPEIYVSKPKEPNFFAFEPNSVPACVGPADTKLLFELLLKYTITSPEEYAELFSGGADCAARGEASVRYLYESHVPAKVAAHTPDAKLIVLLRDPIDRLHSHYHMNVRQHIEPESLTSALTLEDQRVSDGAGWDWHYRRVGCYAEQLQRWYQHFDRAQVLVLFQDDLQSQPQATMTAIFRHLEVASDFVPDFAQRAMVGHTPRWQRLRRIIRDDNIIKTVAKRVLPKGIRKSFVSWSETRNRKAIPPLDAKLRQTLSAEYSEGNQHLADLLERRLPW
ncbi:MAG: sulfotransferase [Planctomycetota bacterium]